MTESVISVPPAAPAPAQTLPGTNAAATEATDASANGQFQSALERRLQELTTPTGDALPAGSGALSALLQTVVGDAKPATDKADQDGTDLPLPGQILPLDPSLLAIAPPVVLPAGEVSAVLTTNAAAGGMTGARLNLAPVANAVAQDGGAAGQTAHTLPDLVAALTPQHDTVAAVHTAALAAELSAQTAAAPVTAAQPAVLTHALTTSSTQAPTAAAVPAITIPLAQPGWEQALGQRVQWLVGQQLQSAELRITPPHLGPIEVRISIGQDQQTVVNFASPHAAVRDAIEAAVPRLRDMLGSNGQDVVNVNVSQHSFAEQRRQAAPSASGRENSYHGELPVDAMEGVSGASVPGRAGLGLVDYFA